MYKAIIFDMDGVLIDARDWHFEALNHALSPFGFEISREEHDNRFNGLSTKTKLEIISSENGLPRDLHQTIFNIKQDQTLRIASEKCYPLIEHQILFSRLKVIGIRIGVYTNSINDTAKYMLQRANVYHFLEVLITNQDVKNSKPDPEGYLLACSNLKIAPSDPKDVNLDFLSTYITELIDD